VNTKEASSQGKSTSAIKSRWGAPLYDAGWTAIPNIIFQRQRVLGLSSTDINILLHIIVYWWEPKDLPFPAKETIAAAMGITPRHVQRRIAALETGGLIKRVYRTTSTGTNQSNIYDLAGLIKHATPLAVEANKDKEDAKKAKLAKFGKKVSGLGVAKSK